MFSVQRPSDADPIQAATVLTQGGGAIVSVQHWARWHHMHTSASAVRLARVLRVGADRVQQRIPSRALAHVGIGFGEARADRDNPDTPS
jgi:hypothetical protein